MSVTFWVYDNFFGKKCFISPHSPLRAQYISPTPKECLKLGICLRNDIIAGANRFWNKKWSLELRSKNMADVRAIRRTINKISLWQLDMCAPVHCSYGRVFFYWKTVPCFYWLTNRHFSVPFRPKVCHTTLRLCSIVSKHETHLVDSFFANGHSILKPLNHEMPMASTLSRTSNIRTADTISWTFSIVSSVVTLIMRSERSESFVLVRPQRNSVNQFFSIYSDGAKFL